LGSLLRVELLPCCHALPLRFLLLVVPAWLLLHLLLLVVGLPRLLLHLLLLLLMLQLRMLLPSIGTKWSACVVRCACVRLLVIGGGLCAAYTRARAYL
jgi:hypothetical protein